MSAVRMQESRSMQSLEILELLSKTALTRWAVSTHIFYMFIFVSIVKTKQETTTISKKAY